MNEIVAGETKIEDKIYEIRGKQVMLDSDLAKLYEVETKRINEAVKNNIEKFPERFSWNLSEKEWNFLRSKISTLEKINGRGRYRKYSPRVFTEQGVAMLATVLKSKIATKVSINIMDAFVTMRKYVSNELLNQKYYNEMVVKHENEIKSLQESFNKFEEKKKVHEIYFNGQIYDAYSKIIDILKEAKESVVIIDAYADKTVLDIISKLNVNVRVVCKKKTLLTKMDIEKYNAQYNNLEIVYDDTFHDRYFILDNQKVYHCGTSLNKIGYKTFSINKIEDKNICDLIINAIRG